MESSRAAGLFKAPAQGRRPGRAYLGASSIAVERDWAGRMLTASISTLAGPPSQEAAESRPQPYFIKTQCT